MMRTVITTWLAWNLSKGTRRAAKRRGLTPLKGVYQGHRNALGALLAARATEIA